MKKLPIDKLNVFFKTLAITYPLFLPVEDEAGQAKFDAWKEGAILSKKLNTVKSAKEFFFPQVENMMDFKVEGKKIEIVDLRSEKEDFIIFGAKACDVRSFTILDSVYLADPVDSFYKNRRDRGIVFTMACNRPESSCFCENFAIDPTNPEGDVVTWMDETTLYLEAKTPKGKKVLASLDDLLEDTDTAAVKAQQKATKEVLAKLPFAHLDLSNFKKENMMQYFNSPQWEQLSESCLACGTCTYVCPTCQCYDIRDFDTGHGIKRFRCWDSCMFSDFTKMAHGNPRVTQKERFRQRFMHKLIYYPSNNEGVFGCVGCGRCLNKCPVSMNIVKVIKALEEE